VKYHEHACGSSHAVVRLPSVPIEEEEITLTKAEFVDRIATKFDSRRAAADAVDAVLEGVSSVLAGGGDVNFTGFGKFSVAERGPRQGVNPRTGERITIAGGRVPKFSAGAGLKSRVKASGSPGASAL
jgi:DNA-binding protein HU-beta